MEDKFPEMEEELVQEVQSSVVVLHVPVGDGVYLLHAFLLCSHDGGDHIHNRRDDRVFVVLRGFKYQNHCFVIESEGILEDRFGGREAASTSLAGEDLLF